jgi:TP901 family phage tail tape measure protein
MSEQIKRSDISEKDIYEFVTSSAKNAEQQIEKLNNSLRESAKLSNDTLKKNGKMSNAAEIKATEQAIKQTNDEYKRKLKLENDLIKIQADKINAETKLRNATDKSTQSIKNQDNAYKKLVVQTRDLKNESKRLGAELLHLEQTGKKNTKEFALIERQYRQTTAEAVVLDGKLKKLDSTVGDNFRNVGNYDSAVGKLRGGLTRLAAGFGVFEAVKFGGRTIMDFETSIADLSAVTGQTGNDLKFLEDKAIEFSKAYGTSAKDVSEAFKLAGSARPELLKNGDALAKITEQALILSKASGDDVPTSIANLTGTLNAFNMPATEAGSVMDILASAAQQGAQEIPYLNEAFTKFGGVAANAGIGIAESAAAVEILGEKMPEASVAGNNLKNIMIILQTNAAKQGREFKGLTEELAMMQPNLKNVTELEKLFGKENLLAAQTLIGQTDRLKEFSGALGESGTAQEQANTKSKTLSEAWNRLKANTEALFLEFRGGASYFTKFVDFLATNLPTIISVVKELAFAFVTFKGVMKGMQLVDQYKNWKNLKSAIAETGTATTEAGQKAQGFGNALKGIGWTIAISLAFEFGKELWNIVSGAKQAEENLARMNRQMQAGSKRANERTNQRQKELQQSLDLAKTEKEKIALTKNAQTQIKEDIKLVNERKEKTKQEIAEIEKYIQVNKGKLDVINLNKDLNNSINGAFGMSSKDDIRDVLAQRKADLSAQNEALKIYSEELENTGHSVKVLTKDELENTEQSKKGTQATKQKTTEVEELNKTYEEYMKTRKELTIDEYKAPELQFADIESADERIKARRKSVAEIKVVEAELSKDEEKIRKARIEQINENLAIELENVELTEIEKLELKKRAELEIQNLEQQANQKKYENFKQWADLTTDYFIKKSEKRIEQIDKEISAAEKQYDYFQELAKNGNITAEQSLAEQQKIINDANLKKQKEQQRIERLKLIQTSLDIYGAKVANGDKNPLLNTIKDVQLLKQFIESLPAFESGTENTGANGKGLDGKGGFLSVLHPYERVVDAENNASIGNLSNDELSNIAKRYNTGQLVEMRNIDTAGNSYDLMPLLSEIKDLKRTIENRPTHNIALGEITQSIMQIVEKTTKGNTTNVTKYNIRK